MIVLSFFFNGFWVPKDSECARSEFCFLLRHALRFRSGIGDITVTSEESTKETFSRFLEVDTFRFFFFCYKDAFILNILAGYFEVSQ